MDGNKETKKTALCRCFIIMFFPLLIALTTAGCDGERRAAEMERLRQERQALISRLETLKEEQKFLMFEKEIYATDRRYLVLDMRSGAGFLRIRGRVLREFRMAMEGCALPETTAPESASSHMLPRGAIQLIAKKKDPVWYKPDWLYEKEGKAPPGVNSPERLIKGPMGRYALFFGGGFVIHGRPVEGSQPAPMEHACIILEDEDLRAAYELLDKGSTAYVK